MAEVVESSKEMIRPTIYGQIVIFLVFVPCLTFQGVEGKMFKPMALTVVLALVAAFVLSLTLIPAMVAIVIRGRVKEKENFLIRGAKRAYEPTLRLALRLRWGVVTAAVLVVPYAIGLARALRDARIVSTRQLTLLLAVGAVIQTPIALAGLAAGWRLAGATP